MAHNQQLNNASEQASATNVADEKSTNSTSVVDMDATTESGGPADERFSKETGETINSHGDSYEHPARSNESRSDTSRVSGIGVSGGTGDTDSSQSGGRSQY